MLVPCGKCSVCVQSRAADWKRRLDVEASQHKYTFFVTLTYSDDTVPEFEPLRYQDYPYLTDHDREDIFNYISEHDVSPRYLVLRYQDIQLFMKRLRNYINRDDSIPEEEKNIRFYACGEYGETTYRPHWHLLIYHDSDDLALQMVKYASRTENGDLIESYGSLLGKYCHQAWTISDKNSHELKGKITVEPVKGNASQYLSKYVNSTCDLPEFLRSCRAFRPCTMASRCPSIGSFKLNKEKAKEIIDSGSNTLFNEFGNEFDGNVDLPLYRSLKDRLFPTCERFFEISINDRYLLYNLFTVSGKGSFDDLMRALDDNQIERLAKVFKLDDSFGGSPYDILQDPVFEKKLRRHYRMSKYFEYMCSQLHYQPYEYIAKIQKFHENRHYDNLKKQLVEEENIAWTYGAPFALTYVDPLVFDNVHVDSLSFILESFGLDDDCCPVDFSYQDLEDVKAKIVRVDYWIDVGKSYKRKSDYVMNRNCKSNLYVI